MLKHVATKEFNKLALSLSSLTLTPLWDRDGIEEADLLRLVLFFSGGHNFHLVPFLLQKHVCFVSYKGWNSFLMALFLFQQPWSIASGVLDGWWLAPRSGQSLQNAARCFPHLNSCWGAL